MRTVADVLATLPQRPDYPLPAPRYDGTQGRGLGLAVESMARHTTDEGWQLFLALEAGGYYLAGHDVAEHPLRPPGSTRANSTDVPALLRAFEPGVVVIQDKREWLGLTADRSQDPRWRFHDVGALARRSDVFKLTVLKDAQNDYALHREAALEIGCHAWIVYYHPQIVARLCPFVRPEHLVRTYHSLDADLVPPFQGGRRGTILSGALSRAYPLRQALAGHAAELGIDVLPHPGYHRQGCQTSAYLQTLARYCVAVCTSSVWGYALRKIVEATACGCRVLTDLPDDELLPQLEGNLTRVEPGRYARDPMAMKPLLDELVAGYDEERQLGFAGAAVDFYDYRHQGRRLAGAIEDLRRAYAAG